MAKYRILQEWVIKTNVVTKESTKEQGDYILQKRSWLGEWTEMWLDDLNLGHYATLPAAKAAIEKYLEKKKIRTTYKYDVVWELK